MNKLTVHLRVKQALWYKIMVSLLLFIGRLRLIKLETIANIVCKIAGKGFKYKINGGTWKPLNQKLEWTVEGEGASNP